MTSQRILFIGGSGVISASSVRLAVADGHRVTVLNRGHSSSRQLPEEVETLVADATDHAAVRAAIGDRDFDTVAQFRAFSPEHVAADVDLFTGRVGQYVFISSASAYQKPPSRLPVTESTPLRNPFWQYSRDKIAGEDLLVAAYRDAGFPATIVRPSHTYDKTLLPTMGHWTDVARMRAGKPVVVHGDGTSQWTLTHADDFAVAFVGLLGHPAAIGEAFSITGSHAPTWNQIYTWLGRAAGTEPELVRDPAGGRQRDQEHQGAGVHQPDELSRRGGAAADLDRHQERDRQGDDRGVPIGADEASPTAGGAQAYRCSRDRVSAVHARRSTRAGTRYTDGRRLSSCTAPGRKSPPRT